MKNIFNYLIISTICSMTIFPLKLHGQTRLGEELLLAHNDGKPFLKKGNSIYLILDSFSIKKSKEIDFLDLQISNDGTIKSVNYVSPPSLFLTQQDEQDINESFLYNENYFSSAGSTSLKLELQENIILNGERFTQKIHTFCFAKEGKELKIKDSQIALFNELIKRKNIIGRIKRNFYRYTSPLKTKVNFSDINFLLNLEKNKTSPIFQEGLGRVSQMAISSNGRFLAIGNKKSLSPYGETKIDIFDLKNRVKIKSIKGHDTDFSVLFFNSENTKIYSASTSNNDLRVVELNTGIEKNLFSVNIQRNKNQENLPETLEMLGVYESFSAFSFSDNGKYLALTYEDNLVVIDIVSERIIKKIKTPNASLSKKIKFFRDNKYILELSDDNLFSYNLTKEKTSPNLIERNIIDFDLLKNQTLIILSSKGIYRLKLFLPQKKNLKTLLFSIDHKEKKYIEIIKNNFVLVFSDSLTEIFNLEENRKLGEFGFDYYDYHSIAIDKKNGYIYKVDNLGLPRDKLSLNRISIPDGHEKEIFSSLGNNMSHEIFFDELTSTLIEIKNAVLIWDLKHGALIDTFKVDNFFPSPIPASTMTTFSNDELIIAKTVFGINIVDKKTRRNSKLNNVPYFSVRSMQILDDNLLAICNAEGISIWDYKKKIKISEINHPNLIDCLFLTKSLDGKYLISGQTKNRTISVWDYHFGKEPIYEVPDEFGIIRSLNMNKNNELLLVTGAPPAAILIYDLKHQKRIGYLTGDFLNIENVTFNKAGNLLAFSTGNSAAPIIKVYSFPSLKEKMTFSGHEAKVHSICFNDSKSRLITGDQNGENRVWDINSGQHLYSFSGEAPDNFIILSDNYYKTSRENHDNVSFSNGLTAYPFEYFDLLFNRPDKVLERIGQTTSNTIKLYYKAYQKRLKKLNFTEAMLSEDFHVPELKITTDKLPIATSESQLHIDINASDTKQKLDRINVYIKDVPIYGINGINLRPQNTQNWEQTLNLTLSKGENKIQVSTLNQGGAESLKETIYVTYDAPKTKNNLYLIGVGIEKFKNSKLNLSYPIKDIRDMVDLYQQKANQYNNIYVDTLFNKNISLEHLQTIKQKLQNSKVDDQVVLFVAGHGILDDSLDYYLATYDTDFSNLTTKGISYEQLENLLDGIPARQKLFLMDACHSGEIDKESVALIRQQNTTQKDLKLRSFENQPIPTKLGLDNSFELMKELFVDLRRGTGATVISSASGVEFAREGDKWQNSVFAYALLSGLKELKADLNKDGKVMVSELQKYVTDEVSVLTDNHQKPTMRLENISNDWQVW